MEKTNPRDTRSYWLLLCEIERACLRGERPQHNRRGTQGQCIFCWQEMIQQVQKDTLELLTTELEQRADKAVAGAIARQGKATGVKN